jgi:hypothetical protein
MSDANGGQGGNPEDKNPTNPVEPPNPPAGNNEGDGGDGDDKGSKTVPHGLYHSEREKRKEAQAELQKLRDEKAEAERKAAEEKGEFKTLYEEEQTKAKGLLEQLEAKNSRIEEFENRAKENIGKMLGQIKDETDRKTVEELLDGKTPDQQERLLPNLLEKYGLPQNINRSPQGGAGGGGSNSEIDKQIEELTKQKDTAVKDKDGMKVLKLTRKIDELKAQKNT